MAEESQDDKTEEPTARRLEKAKEDGQVLRSQDMTIAAVTCTVIASLYLGGFWCFWLLYMATIILLLGYNTAGPVSKV